MRIEDLSRAGSLSLVRGQQADGSWAGDEAATTTAIEAFAEAVFGPDILCRQSWLGRQEGSSDAWQLGWPLAFSYGLSDTEDVDSRLVALYKGFQLGWRRAYRFRTRHFPFHRLQIIFLQPQMRYVMDHIRWVV
jgi:hypothetical protein